MSVFEEYGVIKKRLIQIYMYVLEEYMLHRCVDVMVKHITKTRLFK